MFYSFHAGLGYNFLGLWAYYLASPLNLVIALVSKSMLTMILSHLYVLKIALCCFTAAFYFRKRRGKDEISMLRSEWHMDYAVIWLATVGILCGWKS